LDPPVPTIYRFDRLVLDTARRELRRDGALVDIEPQVLDLLLLLIRTVTGS
jgi:DNA-binding winged helix-turn-helix (wHTH) protein